MALIQRREKKTCEFCRKRNSHPRPGATTLCVWCRRPGPWAIPEEIAEARSAEEEEKRAAIEEHRQEIRVRLTEFYEGLAIREGKVLAALELKPILIPGFFSDDGEDAYIAMPSLLFDFRRDPNSPTGENWIAIDEGKAIVTDRRILFLGASRNAEWRFDKLIGLDVMHFEGNLDLDLGMIRLLVTNRPKGDAIRLEDVEVFMWTWRAAMARFKGEDAPDYEPIDSLELMELNWLTIAAAVPARSRPLLARKLQRDWDLSALESLDLTALGVAPEAHDALLELASTPAARDILVEMLGGDAIPIESLEET